MKISNIALATLTFMLSSFPDQAHAKDTIELAGEDTVPVHNAPPTFQSPQDEDEDEPITRYIVKYKAGSQELKSRMQQASVTAQKTNIRGGYTSAASNTTPSRNSQLLTLGSFLPKDDAEVVYLSSGKEVQAWEEKDDVEYVELDTKVYLQGEVTPYGITNVHALDVPDTDVSNRKVCIIDTGYDITHPDLTSDPNVVTGYEGNFRVGSWDYDGHGHGTHVAGIIAAIGGNDKGVIGVNRNGQVKLHIVKVFNRDGAWAWGSDLIAAAEECVDSGSNIVNMSVGRRGGPSQIESDAFERMFKRDNVLLVASAGNQASTAYSYPASYEYVMSVAATDSNNDWAYFSQRNDQVDIAAPGVEVLSTVPSHVDSSGYGTWSGTSMAVPYVSGVAALVWSLDTSKSAAEIRGILEASAQDLGEAGRDNKFGHGLVRADKARDIMDTFTLSPTISPSPTSVPTISPRNCRPGTALLRVQVVTDANGAAQNRFVIKKKNFLGNFGFKVWDENNFENSTTKVYQKCLGTVGCYKLFMFDTGGDGMCCDAGEGGFKATWRGSVIVDTLTNSSFNNGDKKKVRFGKCS